MTNQSRRLEVQLRTCRRVIGVGGIGSGICFELQDDHDLGRNESRAARLTDARDYCKLHIIMHYLAALLNYDRRGPRVHLVPIGKVGNDAAGTQLLIEMEAQGIDITHVATIAGAPTLFSVCYQFPDRSGGNITASNSAASQLTNDDLDRTRKLFEESSSQTIALAVPEVPLDVREYLIKLATEYGAFRVGSFTAAEILNIRESDWLSLLDLIALNEEEASKLVGHDLDPLAPDRFLERCCSALTTSSNQTSIVVSAGKHGAFGFDGNEWIHSPAFPTNVVSTAGAGDALLAGTLAALILGSPFTNKQRPKEINSALDFGVLFAGYSTTSRHSIHPQARLDDVLAFAQRSEIRLDGLPGRSAALS